MGYTAKKRKICIYIVPKCANCRGNHQAIIFKYLARQKARADAQKNKEKKAQDKEKKESSAEKIRKTSVEIYEDRESSPKPVEIELDINTNWAQSPIPSSDLGFVEDSAPQNAQDLQ